MTDETTFAAMLTHVQAMNESASAPEKERHRESARQLARELLEVYPPDLLVVTAAQAPLGVLAEHIRRAGGDPLGQAAAAEMRMNLDEFDG